MSRNDNDILRTKDSRFSDEDRARIAQENAGARLQARRLREENAQQEVKRQKAEKEISSDDTKKEAVRAGKRAEKLTAKAVPSQNKSGGKKKTAANEKRGSRNDRIKDSQQERKKSRKRNNNLIIFMVFVVAVAVIGIFAAFALKVNVTEVTGSDRYSDASVLEAAGLDATDSMLLINTEVMEHKIETLLPFIETAEIKRVWPDKIMVELTDAVPALAVDTGEGFVLLNSSCKVLDDDAVTIGTDAAYLKGVKIKSAVPGKTVEFTGDISTEDFSSLVEELNANGITGISEYDLSVISDISVIIDHRVEVKFGTLAGAVEKFRFGKQVIDKTIAEDSKHTMIVDLTAEGKAYVRNKNDSNVSFDEIPEETTLAAEETTAVSEGFTSVG